MDVTELHQYVSQLREYIVTLERRIEALESQVHPTSEPIQSWKKVIPPRTRDLGNGRRGFTRAGINSLMDGLVGAHRRNPETGEWEKIR